MDLRRIAELLAPFEPGEALSAEQLQAFSTYLDVLMRWNERINLTSIRSAEQIVTRHFGESLFAARHLLALGQRAEVADLGSGAGFPGLPLKIIHRSASVVLIESQNKKATFLREVIRALKLTGVQVIAERAETLAREFDLVTMRAVERFERALPVAAGLVCPGGRLALLIGAEQAGAAQAILSDFQWQTSIAIPQSTARVLLLATKSGRQDSNQ